MKLKLKPQKNENGNKNNSANLNHTKAHIQKNSFIMCVDSCS